MGAISILNDSIDKLGNLVMGGLVFLQIETALTKSIEKLTEENQWLLPFPVRPQHADSGTAQRHPIVSETLSTNRFIAAYIY
jgi:hypothetical protein